MLFSTSVPLTPKPPISFLELQISTLFSCFTPITVHINSYLLILSSAALLTDPLFFSSFPPLLFCLSSTAQPYLFSSISFWPPFFILKSPACFPFLISCFSILISFPLHSPSLLNSLSSQWSPPSLLPVPFLFSTIFHSFNFSASHGLPPFLVLDPSLVSHPLIWPPALFLPYMFQSLFQLFLSLLFLVFCSLTSYLFSSSASFPTFSFHLCFPLPLLSLITLTQEPLFVLYSSFVFSLLSPLLLYHFPPHFFPFWSDNNHNQFDSHWISSWTTETMTFLYELHWWTRHWMIANDTHDCKWYTAVWTRCTLWTEWSAVTQKPFC